MKSLLVCTSLSKQGPTPKNISLLMDPMIYLFIDMMMVCFEQKFNRATFPRNSIVCGYHMMFAKSHPLQAGIVNVKKVPEPLVAVLM